VSKRSQNLNDVRYYKEVTCVHLAAVFGERNEANFLQVLHIFPICVHLRNLRTINLVLIHPHKRPAQDRAWKCAEAGGSLCQKRPASRHRRSDI